MRFLIVSHSIFRVVGEAQRGGRDVPCIACSCFVKSPCFGIACRKALISRIDLASLHRALKSQLAFPRPPQPLATSSRYNPILSQYHPSPFRPALSIASSVPQSRPHPLRLLLNCPRSSACSLPRLQQTHLQPSQVRPGPWSLSINVAAMKEGSASSTRSEPIFAACAAR